MRSTALMPAWGGVNEHTDVLDRVRAAEFVRAQASWLRRGLHLADNRAEVSAVLATHEASHETWVSLIAAVERELGESAVAVISALYGYHGRVVGALEHPESSSLALRIEPEVRTQVRRMLAEHLTQLTSEAAELFEQ